MSLNSHPIPRALSDLMQSHYQRIAMGVPESVPAGRYAKNVLERSGHWRGIEKKVIRAQTVRQALDYVARAEVEAGFVYVTDAAMMPNQVKVAFVVPTEVPILYPIASVSGGMNHAMALKFIEFVQSPLAQGVLAQYGFGKP